MSLSELAKTLESTTKLYENPILQMNKSLQNISQTMTARHFLPFSDTQEQMRNIFAPLQPLSWQSENLKQSFSGFAGIVSSYPQSSFQFVIPDIFKESLTNKFQLQSDLLKGLSAISNHLNNNDLYNWGLNLNHSFANMISQIAINEIELDEKDNEIIQESIVVLHNQFYSLNEKVDKLTQIVINYLSQSDENSQLEQNSWKASIKSYNVGVAGLIIAVTTFVISTLISLNNPQIINNITNNYYPQMIDKSISAKKLKSVILIASCQVNLRNSANSKSKILCIIPEGQEVLVIEEKRKWIYIQFHNDQIDYFRGWAYKEYFENVSE